MQKKPRASPLKELTPSKCMQFNHNATPSSVSATKPTLPPSATKPPLPLVHYYIGFSGFKDKTAYSLVLKNKLINAINLLPNATALLGPADDYDDRMTHVIASQKSRTVKTFGASLCGAWIITDYNWVFESLNCGKWINETKFGVKYSIKPFNGKNYYLAEKFKEENKEKGFREKYVNLLIRLGGGTFVDDENGACYLGATSEKNKRKGQDFMDWNDFVTKIAQP